MIDGPVYVSPFLGAGADWLCLLGGVRLARNGRRHLNLTPLCSWMGGKRDEAPEILALLDLRPGQAIPAVLGDASWWGKVWPVCLDPVTGPEVSTMLRFWRERGDDPRELWFGLRAAGPLPHPVEAAAQLLWLQARAASGVPVWWEGTEVLAAPGDGRKRQRAYDRGGVLRQHTDHCGAEEARQGGLDRGVATLVQMAHERGPYEASMSGDKAMLVQWASTQIDEAGQRQASLSRRPCGKVVHGGSGGLRAGARGDRPAESYEASQRAERLVATTRGGQVPGAAFEAGHKGIDSRGGGGIVDPATIAHRLDKILRRAIGDTIIEHRDALDLLEEWAPRLGKRARIYLDGPYDGATGYPATCPRDRYLQCAETGARHGAPVVVSEAVGLAQDLGRGWDQVQLRGGDKPEWVTCYGCDVRDILPPFQRLCPADQVRVPA